MAAGLLSSFFDRVIKQAFSDLVLDDTPAARYLTDLLTGDFGARRGTARGTGGGGARLGQRGRLAARDPGRVGPGTSSTLNLSEEDTLRRHIGDYTLFMTGIFRDHVERLAITSYDQHEGRRAYRSRVGDGQGRRAAPRPPCTAGSPIASSSTRGGRADLRAQVSSGVGRLGSWRRAW